MISRPTQDLAVLAKQLLAVLRDELAVHDDLLRLTTAERTAITMPTVLAGADGPLPLEYIVAEKEAIVARLTELERQRSVVSRALAIAVGCSPDAVLSDVLPRLAPPLASALEPARALLLARAQALVAANAANAALLNAALTTTRATLGSLRALQSSAYQSDGQPRPAAPASRWLDRQA